ncbi:hypothetical conserved protein [Candidatus Nitrosoglobus terrae]|uniref:Hypothetical conserved protein n=1 Tax=Candidatus Nitrosoglobus terrae TaxID=1630141 RepID=A0A1Q2SMR1_9GAMM|nr:hypothetical protein [Candidatus Nitrosoglobus terrae]BAW80397.1 hypothetical conserved protein [Candidatus Nitrosoglobus terrae]
MFSNTFNFIKELYTICLREAGPQKLPSSIVLLIVSLIFYIIGRFLVDKSGYSTTASVFLAMFDATLLILMASVPLILKKSTQQIPQTLIALASAGFVVSIIEEIFLFLLRSIQFPENAGASTVVAFLLFPMLLWRVLINITVLRHALSSSTMYASILADSQALIVIFWGKAIASSF